MAGKDHSSWRGVMPTYHKFEWEDFKVRAKPLRWRRIIRFFPYFTGNQPTFRVTIDTISGEPRQLTTLLEFLEPDLSAMEASRVLSSRETPVSNISEEIRLHPIGVSGDHRFQIRLESEERGSYQRDIVTFTAISGDRTTMTIFAVLLVIAGGIIGGLIVQFLFGGQPK